MNSRGIPSSFLRRVSLAVLAAASISSLPLAAQLDESCVVNVLNRSTQVKEDGTWAIPNAPANTGPVRARATCVENGITRSGQSDFFLVPANGAVDVPDIVFAGPSQAPVGVTVSASPAVLDAAGATAQLSVIATFPDGSTSDVTTGAAGTGYTVSNPAVATVDADGAVTAVASGTVLVSALHDGALGLVSVRVVLSGDTDGDGIPDDVELAAGLDPNDPVDAFEDADDDGLTNFEELIDFGTDPRNPDTDGDGIVDGEETIAGEDGFVTSPLLADTDGDGLRDGLEVDTGSDPTDPNSFNLAAALASMSIDPAVFVLTFNDLLGEASRQLTVTGTLIDGFTIDLTSTARGTNYTSSNLAVCSFGVEDGRVFAGNDGTCTVTASNSGFSATSEVTVETFSPTALAFVAIPGYANNVDVVGDFAFVAAGSAGLVVVDVANPASPSIAATLDTAGNANDVKVMGGLAYVADGGAGLAIIDVADPAAPFAVATADTPGVAQDVDLGAGLAYVADGGAGLTVVDVADPAAPAVLATLDTPGQGKGVAVDGIGALAVVADGTVGIQVVDVSDPAAPRLVGGVDTGDARDVALADGFAFVADFASSFTAVDLADPASPQVRASTPLNLGGRLHDVVIGDGFGFGADVLFVNGVPIVDVRVPASPVARAILDFRAFRDDNGTGIAVDGTYVYLTASRSILENGSSGDTRLYIGQYLNVSDDAGVPPTVTITSPADGAEVIEGVTLLLAADASDDFGVAAVEFLVDGAVVLRDAVAPYELSFAVPLGLGPLEIGARAFDRAGNVGVAAPVTVTVIPDPLTTVIGRVVDPDGNAVAGADVSVNGGLTGVTTADGTFSLAGVPTVLGDIVVEASAVILGEPFDGDSAPVAPVPAGVTDVGDIEIDSGALVGYYDLTRNRGVGTQVQPILTAGFEAADVGDLRTADLDQYDILFVQNPSNSGYSSIFRGELQKLHDWVAAGGVLLFHDRHVSTAASVLPGNPGTILRNFSDDRNIDILDDTTPVTDGPGGILDNTSLDGGNSSSHGYATAATLPADARAILSTGNPQNVVLYAYGFGAGTVAYSTIPLDFYLAGSGPSGVSSRMRLIYAPNVLSWANELR